MLRQLRSKNLKNWIYAGLLLVVVPSFVVFYGWGQSQQSQGPTLQPASIDFEGPGTAKILQQDLRTAEQYLRGRLQAYGQHTRMDLDQSLIQTLASPKALVNEAIDIEILRQFAREHDITVSVDEVNRALQQSIPPASRQMFLSYLQQRGQTLDDYVATMQTEMLINKVRETLGSQVRVTNYEAWIEYLLRKEKLSAEFVRIDSASFMSKVNVDDAELKKYFEENKAKFRVPEQVQYAFVMVTKDDLKSSMTVSQDDITSYYNAHREEFRLPRQVHARQIFLKRPSSADVGTTAPDAISSATEKVRAKANDIHERISKGEDFIALANQYSEEKVFPLREDRNTTDTDKLTTAGGNLGWITETTARGFYQDDWTSAVFAMKPQTVSQPIETSRGFYIVKVESTKEGVLQPLEKVEGILKERLLDELVEPRFQQIGELLKEAAQAEPTLEKVAEATSLTVQLSDKVDRKATFLPKIGSLGEFAEAVSDLQKGMRSQEVMTDEYKHLLMEVREEFPAHDPTFEAARDKVVSVYKNEKASELAGQTAETIKSKATNVETLRTAVVDAGLSTTVSRPFLRLESDAMLGPIKKFEELSARTKPGEVVLSELGEPGNISGYVVWVITAKTPPEQSEFQNELPSLISEMLLEKKEIAKNEFLRDRREELKGKIKIDPAYQ